MNAGGEGERSYRRLVALIICGPDVQVSPHGTQASDSRRKGRFRKVQTRLEVRSKRVKTVPVELSNPVETISSKIDLRAEWGNPDPHQLTAMRPRRPHATGDFDAAAVVQGTLESILHGDTLRAEPNIDSPVPITDLNHEPAVKEAGIQSGVRDIRTHGYPHSRRMGGLKGRPARPYVCACFVPTDKAGDRRHLATLLFVECNDRASGGPGGRSGRRLFVAPGLQCAAIG